MDRVLVIVDMQKDFLDDQVLGNARCRAVVPKITDRLEHNRYTNIILTRDTHFDNYLDTQEGKNLPVKHCIKDTLGWQIVPEITRCIQELEACRQGETEVKIIDKNSFGSLELAEQIHLLAREREITVELTGVCTGICVISNGLLIKAREPEVPIEVVVDCCACVTPESHQTALEAMKLCQIAVI